MNETENESRLARWSRRKRQARDTEPIAPEDQPTQETPIAEDGPPDSELSEGELLEKYQLPDPESLQAGDDFSAFMRQGVPDILRRKALRVLWKSNPALANLDGLIDYGEDFTDAAVVPETIATVYQVGKGIVREVLAPDETPEEVIEADSEALVPEKPDDPVEHVDEHSAVELAQSDPDPVKTASELESTSASKPRTKRMKFSNDG